MAEAITEGTAKLQLDEETGEMVSKSELKKRLQKRAKKAAAAQRAKDNPPVAKPAKDAATLANKNTQEAAPVDPDAMFKQGWLAEVYKERPTKDVVTRFPPEPNGYLHIGHAKAIAVNFGFARHHGGKTILRFDDTNPSKEKEEYFLAIEEVIRWLGFKPDAITYTSDNFQKLYDLAEELIRLEKAYMCYCDKANIQLQRGGKDGKEGPRYRCAHAEQDVETNLKKFRDMKDGKYERQTAFLRMKQDIESGNPMMWDIAAYRMPKDDEPHYRTKDQWKIYPTYDFAHCLCDSFEGISHSLCTTEFILSRESYEWLNKSLGVYEPMQREYGRLNISGAITSKRSIELLVKEKHVRGWTDPRLYTLVALRRRGIPAGSILSFISELGVTTAKTLIPIPRFEQAVRKYLEFSVPRLMLVLDPIRVVISDLGDLENTEIDVPFSPKDKTMGTHKLKVTKVVYIDRADFRTVDSKDYFRLAPGKTVGLLNFPCPIKATDFTEDPETKEVTEIQAVLDRETKKAKAYVHWVPEGSRNVEARVHGSLFKSDDPASVEGGFLNDINPNSETIYPNALIESGFDEIRRQAPWPKTDIEKLSNGPESVRFQAMRVAYMSVDSDTTDDKVILNRIVSLKEDSAKN
ncbi:tRNA synthetases class I (E and q), catalytic domain-containing protein [Sarocladium implicatum]|nr:tRNA synthetases class I (E and q), catalytic domain-containing protein [Sarocladium implicatum]